MIKPKFNLLVVSILFLLFINIPNLNSGYQVDQIPNESRILLGSINEYHGKWGPNVEIYEELRVSLTVGGQKLENSYNLTSAVGTHKVYYDVTNTSTQVFDSLSDSTPDLLTHKMTVLMDLNGGAGTTWYAGSGIYDHLDTDIITDGDVDLIVIDPTLSNFGDGWVELQIIVDFYGYTDTVDTSYPEIISFEYIPGIENGTMRWEVGDNFPNTHDIIQDDISVVSDVSWVNGTIIIYYIHKVEYTVVTLVLRDQSSHETSVRYVIENEEFYSSISLNTETEIESDAVLNLPGFEIYYIFSLGIIIHLKRKRND